MQEAVVVAPHELVLEARTARLHAKLGVILLVLLHSLQVLELRRLGMPLKIVLIEGYTDDMFN